MSKAESFNPERFRELATKAENNNLTDEEVEEVKQHIEHFNDGISGLVDALSVPLNAIGEAMGNVVEAFNQLEDGQDSGVAEIHENHRKRHSHGDTTPQCRECSRFLSAEKGQNRVVCPRCNTPNFFSW